MDPVAPGNGLQLGHHGDGGRARGRARACGINKETGTEVLSDALMYVCMHSFAHLPIQPGQGERRNERGGEKKQSETSHIRPLEGSVRVRAQASDRTSVHT